MAMRILKSYGTEGGVIISAPEVDVEERANEPVFIEFDGLPVPFFIEEVTPRGGAKYFVKLEDIDSLEAAEELVGKDADFEGRHSGGHNHRLRRHPRQPLPGNRGRHTCPLPRRTDRQGGQPQQKNLA